MKNKEIKEKRQDRKNKGITLIALVVTIVVLLILAAVSISMLTGENGIITQAIESKEENDKAEEKEKVQLAAQAAKTKTEWGEITEANLKAELDTNIGNGKYTLTNNGDKFTVTYNDSNRSYEIDADGNVTELKPREEGVPGKRYDEDTDITIGGEKITIPGGATISKIAEEYESVDKGVVIYIIPEGETVDWTAKDEEGVYEVQKKYDQFVWVPVKNAILDLCGNSVALASDASIKATVQSEIDAGRYPMAIKKDATNYFGVLYGFEDATDTEGNHYVKVTPYSDWTPISTSSYREPAYLAESNFADESSYNNVGITETSLQGEFNTMVTRVASKGGFWVGRYETSSMVSDNTQDTTNRVTVIRGTKTGISGDNINWYRMYAQQKAYKSLALTESENVTSSMIWGSQWDQIMIWMKEVENKAKSSYYVINSLTMGNYGTGDDLDSPNSEPAETGNSENYKVKNVFDLAGNVSAWTLEANDFYTRILRGGYYSSTYTTSTRADSREYSLSNYSNTVIGTRATLY